MPPDLTTSVLDDHARPITGNEEDLDPILDRVGDRSLVLLGEATHGTHEFYDLRARITKRLIEEKGFTGVAVEADWPDAYRVNRFVRQTDGGEHAAAALADFERFPTWMWRNRDVLSFVEWLHDHNRGLPSERRVGFFGLDLYSLNASIEAVLDYLDRTDPDGAVAARERYACFDHNGGDAQGYGLDVHMSVRPSCRDAAIDQLVALRRDADAALRRDGLLAEDEHFQAEQNARVVRNAEAYYREMFGRRVNTWNLRDTHMMETLIHLVEHERRRGPEPKFVVWEHNSHLGDARATEASRRGELNVGQLARQDFGDDVVIVGFTTYEGAVTAASDWGAPAEHKRVRPALDGSIESLFHASSYDDFVLRLDAGEVSAAFDEPLLQRMIGVVYRPETERASHYFHCRLARQYDVVVHVDETRAVRPLDPVSGWPDEDAPETYPRGL